MTTGKTIALTRRTFVGVVMSLLINTLVRFVVALLPRSKRLLISWLQSPFAVILEPKKRKPVIASTFSPSICLEVMGLEAMILLFWMLSFKPAFSLSSFTFIKRLFSSDGYPNLGLLCKTLGLWVCSYFVPPGRESIGITKFSKELMAQSKG